ncbi:hypothetical protein FA95DRAFT_1655138 [Auriscalpium vulgare]|uniref:Uncharacterized protein n=1 Tax=Auriscalpium vulgare TaxID=40419 RepID=A0ACB8R650_9AGAM|nr:hypothetical protein FA95DRAFT_1655138 [Auriscalpium vulgare]
MYSLTTVVLLAAFAASCTAAPLRDNRAHVRPETPQPELSARDPFNVGQLSHLNGLGAAIVEPDRDNLANGTAQPELSARDPFNIGELSHLHTISASVVKPDRDADAGLALRGLPSGGGPEGATSRFARSLHSVLSDG